MSRRCNSRPSQTFARSWRIQQRRPMSDAGLGAWLILAQSAWQIIRSVVTWITTKEFAMTALKSAIDLAAAASKPYPNDSAEYRDARTALLAEEIELRRHIERVAAQRRALPAGGEPRDYRFNDEAGKTVGLSDLFGTHDTLVTYFWMYGPQRERPCPMCTAFLGSVDIPSRDISQRVA